MTPASFRLQAAYNRAAILPLIKVEIHAFWQTKFMLLSQMMMPVLYFFFIAIPLSGTIKSIPFHGTWIAYPNYVLVGLMAMNMMSQMTRVIYRMCVDRQYGLFAIKMQSGVHPVCYLLVMSISSLMGYSIQCMVFYVLNLFFQLGMRGSIFFQLWLIGCIAFFFWAGIATIITMHVNDFQTRDTIVSFVITPLSFSAPAFYVWQDAPRFIQYLSLCNPLTYQLEALREVAFATMQPSTLALVIGCSLVSVIASFLSIRYASLLVKEGGDG